MSKWVSVEDELPPIGHEVQVYCPNRVEMGKIPVTARARFIRYEGDSNYYWDNYYGGSNYTNRESVTHWKPMSSPPNTKESLTLWISVDERLPESLKDRWSKEVIALGDAGDVFALHCMGSYWQRTEAFVNSQSTRITHWMPLIYPDD